MRKAWAPILATFGAFGQTRVYQSDENLVPVLFGSSDVFESMIVWFTTDHRLGGSRSVNQKSRPSWRLRENLAGRALYALPCRGRGQTRETDFAPFSPYLANLDEVAVNHEGANLVPVLCGSTEVFEPTPFWLTDQAFEAVSLENLSLIQFPFMPSRAQEPAFRCAPPVLGCPHTFWYGLVLRGPLRVGVSSSCLGVLLVTDGEQSRPCLLRKH